MVTHGVTVSAPRRGRSVPTMSWSFVPVGAEAAPTIGHDLPLIVLEPDTRLERARWAAETWTR